MVKLFTFLLLAYPNGWIWYNPIPKSKTLPPKKKTKFISSSKNFTSGLPKVIPHVGDTLNIPYFMLSTKGTQEPLILHDSLPIEPNTPEPLKRLMLNPTKENARRFLAWLIALNIRSYVATERLKEVLNDVGLEPMSNLTGNVIKKRLQRQFEQSAVMRLRDHVFLVFFYDNSPVSFELAFHLSQLYKKDFFVVGIPLSPKYLSSPIRNIIHFPIKPDGGEVEALGIKVPTLVAVNTRDHSYHIITRTVKNEYEIMRDMLMLYVNRGNRL